VIHALLAILALHILPSTPAQPVSQTRFEVELNSSPEQADLSTYIEWTVDWEKARLQSNDRQLPIILVFSGSDWCAPCIRLEKAVFQQDDFAFWAESNAVMVRADFPRKQRNLSKEIQLQNDRLAAQFNPKGKFPLVVVTDPEGEMLGELQQPANAPQEFIDQISGLLNKHKGSQ
jgi:thioredoxin-related protein